MKGRPLPHAALAAAVPASPIGRAIRLSGRDFEVLRLARADAPIADALLALGALGVGGFEEGGVDASAADADAVWLMRRFAGRTVADLLRERRAAFPLADALAIALGVARALSACEEKGLDAGPLAPDGVRVELGGDAAGARVTLMAAPLVAMKLGDAATKKRGGAPAWTPPEQADGAPWDDAANRYVLGLLLYRMLSGEHPFGGGLRGARDTTAAQEAPPFDGAIAAELPPGLQALTLRMLAPARRDRPGRARAIAEELARLDPANARAPEAGPRGASAILSAVGAGERGSTEHGSAAIAPRRDRPSDGRDRARLAALLAERPTLARYLPLLIGVGLALMSFALLGPAPPHVDRPEVAPREPLRQADASVGACASCHVRQAAEWRRSVMAHSVRSPLFNALESLIEEQVGRDDACPNGAGILRKVEPDRACRDRSGQAITGSGGEHWCVNCHSPLEKIDGPLAAWDGRPGGDASSRRPARDMLDPQSLDGITCTFCHQVSGPVSAHIAGSASRSSATSQSSYEGNATWTSFVTGQVFAARPEDARGLRGIGNSGYLLGSDVLFGSGGGSRELGGAHARPSDRTKSYLASSEFCGSCHDVRLFGTDTLGAARGEHFKRLRNAYSEWAAWSKDQERLGKRAATCQECHMSGFPGGCEPGESDANDTRCPAGTRFVERKPGAFPEGLIASSSPSPHEVSTHYFSGVDVPLSPEFPEALVDEQTVDAHGVPLSARRRRDLLLSRTFRFEVKGASRSGSRVSIPIEIENIGAGHRVPAGFSQEREIWVHLVVKDRDGRRVYEVGDVKRADEDLRDKIFDRVNTNMALLNARGQPEGLFGADVRDGPDVAEWSPPPGSGGTQFRGKGLINFQNGFFRCVRCIGVVAADGHCEAAPGQEAHRADRFADGGYDLDTGTCTSNLSGQSALFETYFPVGALDASRGLPKGPDAIVDTRSMPPGVPLRYTYDLATNGHAGPLHAEAELLFRAFPPFLIKGFAGYEREQARRGLRPSGPLVTEDMLRRLEVVRVAHAELEVP